MMKGLHYFLMKECTCLSGPDGSTLGLPVGVWIHSCTPCDGRDPGVGHSCGSAARAGKDHTHFQERHGSPRRVHHRSEFHCSTVNCLCSVCFRCVASPVDTDTEWFACVEGWVISTIA